MASTVKGTITVTSSAGADITISGLTDPKAIILWGTYQTTTGVTTTVDRRWGIGFGTYLGGAVQQCYGACWGDDGLSTAGYAESVNSDALLRGLSAAGTVDFEIDLVSMDATSVTLDTADAPGTGNIVLHYLVLQGSDVDAEAKLFALSTAAATQDVTLTSGMGNPGDGDPWLSLFFKTQRTATGQASGDIGLSLGFDNGTDKAATLWGGDQGVGNMVLGGWQKTGRSILGFTATPGTADVEANIDSSGHPTDGFQLAFSDQASVGCQVASLHIRGLGSVIGETTSRTTTGNQTITVGETPIGALFAGNSLDVKTTIDTSGATLGAQWMGGTDFSAEGAAGMLDDDGLGFDNVIMWHSTTQAVEMRSPNGSENGNTLQAAADASISGTDVQLAYTTAPGTARGILHLVVYEVASGPVEHERSAAVSATGAIATAGQRALLRSSAVSATGAIAASGIEVIARSAAVSASGAIVVSGVRIAVRAAAVAATGAIAVSGEVETPATTHSRSASLSATGAIASAPQRDVLRATAAGATSAITSAGQRDLLRSATAAATGTVTVNGEILGAVQRSASLTATGAVTAAHQRVLLRSATVTSSATVNAGSLRVLLRTVSLTATGSVQAAGTFTGPLVPVGLLESGSSSSLLGSDSTVLSVGSDSSALIGGLESRTGVGGTISE